MKFVNVGVGLLVLAAGHRGRWSRGPRCEHHGVPICMGLLIDGLQALWPKQTRRSGALPESVDRERQREDSSGSSKGSFP